MNRIFPSVCTASLLILAGCATASLTESGLLSSYASLRPSDGLLTKTRIRADKDVLLAARSVLIIPTVVEDRAALQGIEPQRLKLVSNAIDRQLCRDLSSRFVVVEPDQKADLLVRAAITNIEKTDTTAAGASVVTGIGGKVASAATGLPIPSLRLPLGLGSLSVEAEAKDARNRQVAAFVWARGADSITTAARVSEEADAYTLAGAFASDFAKLLLTGDDPVADGMPMLPTGAAISEYFGGAPKYDACRQFGSHPGLADTLGSAVGVPPNWTDNGAN